MSSLSEVERNRKLSDINPVDSIISQKDEAKKGPTVQSSKFISHTVSTE